MRTRCHAPSQTDQARAPTLSRVGQTRTQALVKSASPKRESENDVQRVLKRTPRRNSAPNVSCGGCPGLGADRLATHTHTRRYVQQPRGVRRRSRWLPRPTHVLHTRCFSQWTRTKPLGKTAFYCKTRKCRDSVDGRVAPPVSGRYHAWSNTLRCGDTTPALGSPESNVGTHHTGKLPRGRPASVTRGRAGESLQAAEGFRRNARPGSQSGGKRLSEGRAEAENQLDRDTTAVESISFGNALSSTGAETDGTTFAA